MTVSGCCCCHCAILSECPSSSVIVVSCTGFRLIQSAMKNSELSLLLLLCRCALMFTDGLYHVVFCLIIPMLYKLLNNSHCG